MRKTLFKRGTAMIPVLFVLFYAACESAPVYAPPPPPREAKWKGVTYTGEDERQLEGTTWTVKFTNGNVRTIEFRRGGKLVLSGFPGNHTWRRTGDIVECVFKDGNEHWEGVYYPENQTILVSAEASDGDKYDCTLTLGVSAPEAAASSASPPVIINNVPAAPAQSSGSGGSGSSSGAAKVAEQIQELNRQVQQGMNQAMQRTFTGTVMYVANDGRVMSMPFSVQATSAVDAGAKARTEWPRMYGNLGRFSSAAF
jgi:hypothetical protein